MGVTGVTNNMVAINMPSTTWQGQHVIINNVATNEHYSKCTQDTSCKISIVLENPNIIIVKWVPIPTYHYSMKEWGGLTGNWAPQGATSCVRVWCLGILRWHGYLPVIHISMVGF